MRIISKFRDFYDSAQAYGAEAFCYKRELEEDWIAADDAESDLGVSYSLESATLSDRTSTVEVAPRVTFFCGSVYKSVEFLFKGRVYSFFDFSEVEDFIIDNIKDRKRDFAVYENHELDRKRFRWSRESIKYFLEDLELRSNVDELHHKYNTPIISYGFGESYITKFDNGLNDFRKRFRDPEEMRIVDPPAYKVDILRTFNPILKNYGFQKLIHPMIANQEISMYLSGVLGATEKDVVEIDDVHMRDAKGFNDMSFKKEPTKKRR